MLHMFLLCQLSTKYCCIMLNKTVTKFPFQISCVLKWPLYCLRGEIDRTHDNCYLSSRTNVEGLHDKRRQETADIHHQGDDSDVRLQHGRFITTRVACRKHCNKETILKQLLCIKRQLKQFHWKALLLLRVGLKVKNYSWITVARLWY